MKTKRYDGGDLRRILIGMATDQTVCSRIANQWGEGGLFDMPFANLVGGWCIKHLEKYGIPPNTELQGIFEDWASRKDRQESVLQAVEKFLLALSDDYANQKEIPSSDYLLDCAGRYFNKVKIKRMTSAIEDDVDDGEVNEAFGRIASITKVELGTGALVKPAEDFDVWRQAFDTERQEQLITYPNYLNHFLGQWMVRDSLIAFMGPDKSGKSMFLLDAAYRALRGRFRVAYFEVGDMGQDAVLRRLGQRAARRPLKAGVCKIPISVDKDGKVEYRTKEFDSDLFPGDSFKAFKRAVRRKGSFRLVCYPNSSINVSGLESDLQNWEREGWTPDVVTIDYADILAPPSGVGETLDQIDETWRLLRRLSQETHTLVLTATQSSAAAYQDKTRVLGRKHFSGRKTKLAHVNGMIGLNVNPNDKRRGITRLNWVVRREGYYNEQRSEIVAGCLAIASPAMRSRE